MQPADWRTISRFGYVFGLLFLLLGLYVYVYYWKNWILPFFLAFNPYRSSAIPLIIIGVFLLITGFFISHGLIAKQKLKKAATIISFGYVFGLIFLLVGIYVYVYYETNWIGWLGLSFYPYRNYALPMIVIGVALLITGFFVSHGLSGKQEVEKTSS